MIPAHLTLFHALAGEEGPSITQDIEAACTRQPPFGMEATGFRSLGRGVALAIRSPDLVSVRQTLSREWRDWLTAQDSAAIAPHVTVQNKVAPDEARRTLADLQATFRPMSIRAEGLLLWRYLGGPWDLARRFRFRGSS